MHNIVTGLVSRRYSIIILQARVRVTFREFCYTHVQPSNAQNNFSRKLHHRQENVPLLLHSRLVPFMHVETSHLSFFLFFLFFFFFFFKNRLRDSRLDASRTRCYRLAATCDVTLYNKNTMRQTHTSGSFFVCSYASFPLVDYRLLPTDQLSVFQNVSK